MKLHLLSIILFCLLLTSISAQESGGIIFSKNMIDPSNPANLTSQFQSGDYIYAAAYFEKSLNEMKKRAFPNADFYYATWESYEDDFKRELPKESCLYLKEPEVTYHPYLDMNPEHYISPAYCSLVKTMTTASAEKKEWSRHHCKQIIQHNELYKSLPEQYDVIVRTRYDIYISDQSNFNLYITDTYENNRANGFGWTQRHSIHEIKENAGTNRYYLCDALIIHPAKAYDTQYVDLLVEEKRLHAAEWGWCQVLSAPLGLNHKNHSGWIVNDRGRHKVK